jgi:hypothetical protein
VSILAAVKQLIQVLEKMPQDKRVEIGTHTLYCGEAKRVVEWDDYVEIESDDE